MKDWSRAMYRRISDPSWSEPNDAKVTSMLTCRRLKPGAERRPYEALRSYSYVRDLLTTVDLFVGVALKKHGLE